MLIILFYWSMKLEFASPFLVSQHGTVTNWSCLQIKTLETIKLCNSTLLSDDEIHEYIIRLERTENLPTSLVLWVVATLMYVVSLGQLLRTCHNFYEMLKMNILYYCYVWGGIVVTWCYMSGWVPPLPNGCSFLQFGTPRFSPNVLGFLYNFFFLQMANDFICCQQTYKQRYKSAGEVKKINKFDSCLR